MRRTSVIAALTVASALALSACGSDDDGGEAADDATATSTASPAPTNSTDSGLEIAGAAGDKPAVTVPADQEAPSDLVVDVVSEGDGAEVKKGDWLVTNYLGQTWDERDAQPYVFDNSWDKGAPAGFPIGEGRVIQGWDDGLVGQQVGSRVALTVPADQAYGGIEHELSEDTLVFVVDILSTVDPGATASGEEVSDLGSDFPVVTSGDNGQPQIDLAEATAPDESGSTVVIEGDGTDIGDGVIINFVQAAYPHGEISASSWDDQGPTVLPSSGYASLPGLEEALTDAKVGTRIVTQAVNETADPNASPSPTAAPADTAVYVIDVIGTYTAS